MNTKTAQSETADASQNGTTIAEFIKQNTISLYCYHTDTNALMDDRTMDHWKCTLRCGGRRMTLVFSKGAGHKGAEPEIDEILDCLASDSAGVENARNFEEWCSEYGYDSDSRKAEKIYKACLKQAASLLNLLGKQEYDSLLWNTERL